MKMIKIASILLATSFGIGMTAACSKTTASAEEATTYVSLRINPEVELLADEDGTVIASNAINEDGEVLLSVTDLEGMSVEDASVAFTETATDLGYFDPENGTDTVYVDVESDATNEDAVLESKLQSKLQKYFTNKGVNGKVSQETLDKYLNSAEKWGLSTGHTKLVMRVLDMYPEMTDTEVLALEVNEWLELLHGGKKSTAEKQLKEDYRANVKALKEEYGALFLLSEEIEALEQQIKTAAAEEVDGLKAQLANKKAELKALRSTYKAELSKLKSDYKTALKELKKSEKH